MAFQTPARTTAVSQSHRVEILTCSIARDVDLFGLLAASIDQHVRNDTHHHVVVPSADMAAFRRFETSNRTIIAQEDVLPVRLWKIPSALRYLSFIKAGLRRPLYLTSEWSMVRGWMLQQLLKIQMSQRSDCAAIMHVDSDVCFFRNFSASDVFAGDDLRFFRALGKTSNPMHRPWIDASCHFLGIDAPQSYHAHYVENCVVWRTDLLRNMVKRIEEIHAMPFHITLFGAATISEYYLYGIYANLIAKDAGLVLEDTSFCNSYWPADETDSVDFTSLRNRLRPKHCALAIQSTHKINLAARAQIYDRARREMTLP